MDVLVHSEWILMTSSIWLFTPKSFQNIAEHISHVTSY